MRSIHLHLKKKLVFNHFYFGRVWWSWKNWFWTFSIFGGYGGLERTYGRCTGKHWGHTRGCLNIWECWGIRGHQGVSECMGASKHMRGVKMPPNIWECQLNAPKCKTYMPLKRIRGFWTYGGVEMDREALGTYKGVFEHMGFGASGWCPNAWEHPNTWGCPDAPKHMGCQLNAPKCKSYMPLKKIRGVWTYGGVEMDRAALGTYKGVFEHMGVLGTSGWHPNAWGASQHIVSYRLPLHELSGLLRVERLWCRNMDVPMVKSNFIIYDKKFGPRKFQMGNSRDTCSVEDMYS